ncbi:glycoside hydrolase family 9 protein [Aquibacillus salsiterrae]|uniref:Endoglucanase n=1 Tax=Aquibacillus salsiterrae TaxID=2950439 RepID=A0A9X3WAQ1_9BACI|nr:glycoside hydrolase family 9 protein [Aquibacillus salsiterrae]MDC3415832.1 glycoside hydrolase family 9 protein [Aquibacillus salsiterrae]
MKSRTITVNQIGYPTTSKKIAMFTGQGGTFEVINEASEVVFRGVTSNPVKDEVSGVMVCSGDFSALTTTGKYRVRQDEAVSPMFLITEKPYQHLHHGLLKAFYYFRCGMELEEEFAGPWKHKACHTTEGIVHGQPDRRLGSFGGWHDAGDYGKYTVAAAKAVADLLLAYDLYPNAFAGPVPLPETDNLTPDVLHECRYELEWLFTMQETDSGGVFHKLTTLHFPGLDVMPEEDLADLYFSPISATATGSYAAIMAMASRVYQPFDASFAARCLKAAIHAEEWLEKHPEVESFKNPVDITTGEYGDSKDIDERYWAFCELYRTTGDDKYHHKIQKLSRQPFDKCQLGWADVGGYGTLAYLLNDETNVDRALYTELKTLFLDEANQLISRSKEDGYLISLTEDEYIWGSNMLVMNHGMILLFGYHLTGDKKYEACALDHLHYLMGRNVLDISYVTGYGEQPVMHPHHRPSVADDVVDPVPGLVAGGPDRGLHDEYVKEHLQGKAPAQCFADHEDSYSTNEVTIYWNSPAVFVVSHWVR